MELSEWLAFLHIVAAILWVGATVVQGAAIARANRNPDPGVVARLARELDWIGPRLIGPAAVAVIVFGVWITAIEDWVALSQTWIWLSLVLVAVSMLLGMAYFGPEGKRIGRIVAERGAEAPEIRRRMDRLVLVGRGDQLILVAVVWLMVFKPGVD